MQFREEISKVITPAKLSDYLLLIVTRKQTPNLGKNYFKYKQIKHTNQKYRLIEWIQKQDPFIYCLQETHFRHRDTYSLKVKGWKRIFHANRNQKKARVAILISDNIDFKEYCKR